MKKALYLITILFSFTINSQTSLDYYFNGDLNFDPKIPKPSEVIGHEVGEWHITHDKLVEYMYKIAILYIYSTNLSCVICHSPTS